MVDPSVPFNGSNALWTGSTISALYPYQSSSRTQARNNASAATGGNKRYTQAIGNIIATGQNASLAPNAWAYPAAEATFADNTNTIFNAVYQDFGRAWPKEWNLDLYDYMNSNNPYDPDNAIAYNGKLVCYPKYFPPSTLLGVRTNKQGEATFGLAGNKKFTDDKRPKATEREENEPQTEYFTYNNFQTNGQGIGEYAVAAAFSETISKLAQALNWEYGSYFLRVRTMSNPYEAVYKRLANNTSRTIRNLMKVTDADFPSISIRNYSKSGAYSGATTLVYDRGENKFFVQDSPYEAEVRERDSGYAPINVQDQIALLAGGTVTSGAVANPLQLTADEVAAYSNVSLPNVATNTPTPFFSLASAIAVQANTLLQQSDSPNRTSSLNNLVAQIQSEIQAITAAAETASNDTSAESAVLLQSAGIMITFLRDVVTSIQNGRLISSVNGNTFLGADGSSILTGIDAAFTVVEKYNYAAEMGVTHVVVKPPADQHCTKKWLVSSDNLRLCGFYFMEGGSLYFSLWDKELCKIVDI